jgi:hypothetical protein
MVDIVRGLFLRIPRMKEFALFRTVANLHLGILRLETCANSGSAKTKSLVRSLASPRQIKTCKTISAAVDKGGALASIVSKPSLVWCGQNCNIVSR